MLPLIRPLFSASSRQVRSYSASARGSLSGFKINSDRLQETIHHTCQWGAAHRYGKGATETGMARLALSDDDAKVRRWFADEVKSLDCSLAVDEMGNMFAKRKGVLNSSAPMTAMGSHLDTQPRGGRYDGILGVLSAVEVLRTLQENGYKTQYDVGIVNWTNEEGARFPNSMMASGVWAGGIPREKAWALPDIFDPTVTVKSELERHGYLGQLACTSDASTGYLLGAHFELHIEQGPILEEAGKQIGVVQGAQAYRWLTFTVKGRDAHTGTTPLKSRKDPLLAASKMIASSNAIAKNLGALASTGVIKIPPSSSTNTIISEVTFTLDVRHPEDSVVEQVQQQCLESFEKIAKEDGRGVEFTWMLDTDSPAVKFDKDCIQAVENAANGLFGADGWLPITSGAGHDSVYTSKRCPTTMIFVPCKDGVSHHPEEYCSPADCANGTQALLEAVVSYDKLRASRQ
ncbi:N-carbamoyl-L-amino-acid hydrolase [Colletotrichum sidae]|uniref:N-carbamoyl-L-amino-acid hydrolase n=1 Tax=Colletotrichum sidae TaxID=1347389 RepID=A0A4R8TAG7_9PEZI|nr:N-carbamoyl-L-amino-acid hydrolase [Colletotrichum sidae]